jgi:hypothetical protein
MQNGPSRQPGQSDMLSNPNSMPGPVSNTAADIAWWGRHSIANGRTDFWQIGPLKFAVQHTSQEWRVHWQHSQNRLDPSVRYVAGINTADAEALDHDATFVFGGGAKSDLSFTPTLADRPVVAKLPRTLHILPGEDVHLFLLTPLWIRLETADPNRTLLEIPAYRPSDTWFGPASNLGELCYASATPAYLDLRDVPLRLHCATTAVYVRNSSTDNLKLDRVSIPVPRLSLFFSSRTGFWTDRISIDSATAEMKLEKQPPQEASPTQFVSGPRITSAEPISAIRSFNAFFSRETGQKAEK